MQSPNISYEALVRDGIAAFQRGDPRSARTAFEQVAEAGHASSQLWLVLAQSCEALGDDRATSAALDPVLTDDPRNPYALIMKGDVFTRAGDDRAAVAWYQQALAATGLLTDINADLGERLRRAEGAIAAANGRFRAHLDRALAAAGADAAAAGPRFGEALAILAGTSQPFVQEPTNFYYPRLPSIPFFDTADFPWVAALEAAMPAIRAEAEAALASDAGLQPYVERPENRPGRPHPLMNDPRWSAFHLLANGEPVAGNAARCPATMAALATAPMPRIPGRAPMALFSILRGGTHIPPHNGMLNTRLICHLPLIVPPGCRLRVGNKTRTVETGKALIFDDSIEHEAWNDSGEARAILLFEIWRPDLSAAECSALTAMFGSIAAYGGDG